MEGPQHHQQNDGGEADVGPASPSRAAAPKTRRFSGIMSRAGTGQPQQPQRRSLMEQQFQSIRHLMDEEDDNAPKTAGQWSQRLQSHFKSKLERGPATAASPAIARTRSQNNAFDGEASRPDLLVQHQRQQGASLSRLENSFTAESIGKGWFSPKRRKSANTTTGGSNNNSKNSDSKSILFPNLNNHNSMPETSSSTFKGASDFLHMSNGPLNMSARDEFEAVIDDKQVKQQQQQQQQQHGTATTKSPPTPTTPTRRSIFGKQLIDFRRKRNGKSASRDQDDEDEESGGFSVTTEKLSAQMNLAGADEYTTNGDHEEEDVGGNNDGSMKVNGNNSSQLRLNASGEFQHVDICVDNAILHSVEVKQEMIEWRREKFKNKLKGEATTTTTKAAILLAETKSTGSGSSSGDGLMIVNRSLTKIKATRKRPGRKRSDGTKKSIALSLSASEASEIKDNDDADEVTVLDDLFDDDDDDFFVKKGGGKKKKAGVQEGTSSNLKSMVFPDKPGRITRARTSSMIESKSTYASTNTTVSSDNNSRSHRSSAERTDNNSRSHRSSTDRTTTTPTSTQRSERTTASVGSVRSQRTSGESLRSQRTSGTRGGDEQTNTMRSERTTSNRSERTESHRTERTAASSSRSHRSTGSAYGVTKEDNLATMFDKAAAAANPRGLRRRASLSSIDDFENSFQIVDGEFLFGDTGCDKQDHPQHQSYFEEDFTTKADKDTTNMFHQSFAADALFSPVKNKRSNGSSVPNCNLLEASISLLSTVDEMSKSSRDDKKLKRRNSLPTGSTHNTAINDDLMGKQRKKSDKTPPPNKGAATPRSSKRNRRRLSTATELQASIARLQTPDIGSEAKSKGSKPEVTGDVEAHSVSTSKVIGLAPPPADIKQQPRRRTSVSEKIVQEFHESKLDQIRMRRRVSHRTSISGETASSKDISKKKSSRKPVAHVDETIWRRRSTITTSAVEAKQSQSKEQHSMKHLLASEFLSEVGREEQRQSRRQPREVKRSSSAGFSHLLKRSMTHEGTTNKSSDASHDESKKNAQRCLTPNSPRRFVRRQTIQVEAPQLTIRTPTSGRKERSRSRRGLEEASVATDTIRHVGLDPSVQGEGSERSPAASTRVASLLGDQSDRMTPPGVRRISRPRRHLSIDLTTTSRSSDSSYFSATPKPAGPAKLPVLPVRNSTGNRSDDEFACFVPTPKPAGPPMLPVLPVRKSNCSKSISSTGLRPRRHKSKDDGLARSNVSTRLRPRRHKSRDGSITIKEPDIALVDTLLSPAKRRTPKSNRRNTAHEALRKNEMAAILSPGSTAKPKITLNFQGASMASLLVSPITTTPTSDKTRAAMDKKLMAELVGSPNKASRFRRNRKTTSPQTAAEDENGAGVATTTKDDSTRSPRARVVSRRSKSDDGGTTTTSVGGGGGDTLVRSYRRQKTEGGGGADSGAGTGPPVRRLRRAKTAEGFTRSTTSKVAAAEHTTTTTTTVDESGGDDGGAEVMMDRSEKISNKGLLNGLSF